MANLGVKEKEVYGYFEFISNSKYSDIAYVELLASRDASLGEEDIVRKYKPEQVRDVIRKAMSLIEKGWEEVKIVFHLQDKETMSYSYFAIAIRYGKETTFSIGVSIKKKERDGRGYT